MIYQHLVLDSDAYNMMPMICAAAQLEEFGAIHLHSGNIRMIHTFNSQTGLLLCRPMKMSSYECRRTKRAALQDTVRSPIIMKCVCLMSEWREMLFI